MKVLFLYIQCYSHVTKIGHNIPFALDLSFQAAQRVMGSSVDQRLKVLRDISQNIPMLAR